MEKKEVYDAYLMRRHNLTHVKEEDDVVQAENEQELSEEEDMPLEEL